MGIVTNVVAFTEKIVEIFPDSAFFYLVVEMNVGHAMKDKLNENRLSY